MRQHFLEWELNPNYLEYSDVRFNRWAILILKVSIVFIHVFFYLGILTYYFSGRLANSHLMAPRSRLALFPRQYAWEFFFHLHGDNGFPEDLLSGIPPIAGFPLPSPSTNLVAPCAREKIRGVQYMGATH